MRESLELDPIEAPIAIAPNLEKAGIPQDAKVLAGGWLREPDKLGQLASRVLACDAQSDELAPGWVREGDKRLIEGFGRHESSLYRASCICNVTHIVGPRIGL